MICWCKNSSSCLFSQLIIHVQTLTNLTSSVSINYCGFFHSTTILFMESDFIGCTHLIIFTCMFCIYSTEGTQRGKRLPCHYRLIAHGLGFGWEDLESAAQRSQVGRTPWCAARPQCFHPTPEKKKVTTMLACLRKRQRRWTFCICARVHL